jgi:hypothetical protein
MLPNPPNYGMDKIIERQTAINLSMKFFDASLKIEKMDFHEK